jgi:hypothetical protein
MAALSICIIFVIIAAMLIIYLINPDIDNKRVEKEPLIHDNLLAASYV